jgi:hypothetical protein
MSSSEASDGECEEACELVIPLPSRYATLKKDRLRAKLEPHVFKGAEIVVEGIEIPEVDIADGLDDDSDTSCEVTFDSYLFWSCENFRIEVRPDVDGTYRIRVDHKPFLQIRNSGCVAGMKQVLEICRHLEMNEFEEAMKILFRRKNGKLREDAALAAVVSESWVRSTYSEFEM